MVYLKILYRRNLDMSSGKIAAQSVHAAIGLFKKDPREYSKCVVLGTSELKFNSMKYLEDVYVVTDTGKTEVEPNTQTVLAFWEQEE